MSRPPRFRMTVAACCMAVTPVAAQTPAVTGPIPVAPTAAARPAGDIVVNMRGVEIRDVAEQVSRVTGRTIVLDPTVQGTVNVVSSEPLSTAGVWDLFRSVLRAQGFTVVRSGGVWRVIPQAAAVQSGSSVDGRRARAHDVVTRLIRLRNLPSDQAVRVLRPLVASFGSIEALADPNAVVVTDYADNVRRIEALARQLDGGGGAALAAITLRHADARDVGQAIERLLGAAAGATPGAAGGPRVAVDERSNIVLVRGDSQDLTEARRVAAALDVPGGAAPVTRVFRLNFGDAETIADILRGVLGGPNAVSNPVARSLGDQRETRIGAGPLNQPGPPQISANPLAGFAAQAGGALGQAGTGQPAPLAAASSSTASATGDTGFAAGGLAIQASPELNAIVVRGPAAEIAALEPLIAELDVRRPQVMIEAAIVEITGDRAEQLGVQLGLGQASPLSGGGAATSFSNLGISIGDILTILGAPGALIARSEGASIGIGSRDDFSILIQALATSTNANLLSTPSITTLDNEPAEIVVGQNVPFRTGSFSTDGNTLTPFTTIQRENVGITLRVVPRIHVGDVVRLQVSQEVSSLVNANIAGAADLITNRRTIQTTTLADNRQTIVLGGLITDDRIDAESRVPVLGDLPVVGNLFRSRREARTRRVLFIFLRPTILRDRESVVAAAQQQYDRLRAQDAEPERQRSLLLEPTTPRLRTEIDGVY